MELNRLLNERFGFQDFRPGQKEIIEAILGGKHVLGVLATGSGKTLCYQMLSQLLDGLTIVVSPLISLMEDQWTRMRQTGFKDVGILHSALAKDRLQKEWQMIEQKKRKLILLSPERLTNPAFLERLAQHQISLLAIDEAHCVSQWGYDFRPDYLKIKDSYPVLRNPLVMALTGTASPNVQSDILYHLGIEDAEKIILSMNRPNIAYHVERVKSDKEKRSFLIRELPRLTGPGIIYAGTRRETEELADWLSDRLKMEIPAYHAGLPTENRALIQTQFIHGQTPLLVATTAFGMGIDKENIRFVIHYQMPTSIEGYLQETGRIGRDGKDGVAILLYTPDDFAITSSVLDYSIPNYNQIKEFYHRLILQDNLAIHHEESDHLPLKAFLYRLEQGGWIESVRTSENGKYHYILKKELDEEGISLIAAEWEQLRMDKRKGLACFNLILSANDCLRKGIHQYFGEKDHGFSLFCCTHCGIDLRMYYTHSRTETEISAQPWSWEEELELLLPIN